MLGENGTAGIWATYPQAFVSTSNGFADQVSFTADSNSCLFPELGNPFGQRLLKLESRGVYETTNQFQKFKLKLLTNKVLFLELVALCWALEK